MCVISTTGPWTGRKQNQPSKCPAYATTSTPPHTLPTHTRVADFSASLLFSFSPTQTQRRGLGFSVVVGFSLPMAAYGGGGARGITPLRSCRTGPSASAPHSGSAPPYHVPEVGELTEVVQGALEIG